MSWSIFRNILGFSLFLSSYAGWAEAIKVIPNLKSGLCHDLLSPEPSIGEFDYAFMEPKTKQHIRAIANRFDPWEGYSEVEILRVAEPRQPNLEASENSQAYFRSLLSRLAPRFYGVDQAYQDMMVTGDTEPQGDWLFYQAMWTLSDYLSAEGVAHYLLRVDQSLHIYISRRGEHDLNRKAKDLAQFGTHLKVDLAAEESLDLRANELSLAGMKILATDELWSMGSEMALLELSQMKMREVTLDPNSREQMKFFMDPDAALPDHLVHVSLMSPATSRDRTNTRFSHRTGRVDESLQEDLSRLMRSTNKINAQGHASYFVALRKPDGAWKLSIPAALSDLGSFSDHSDFRAVREEIPFRLDGMSTGYDYFLFFGSPNYILNRDMRFNHAEVVSGFSEYALDTVSTVHVGVNSKGEYFYHIVTREVRTNRSVTHIKDVLKEPFLAGGSLED